MIRRAFYLIGVGLLGGCGEEPTPPPPADPDPVPVRLALTASDTITTHGGILFFRSVALDSAGAPVGTAPVAWSVSDSGRGRILAGGVFTGGSDTGVVFVRATLARSPLAESVTVHIVPPGTVKWTWSAAEAGGALSALGGPAIGLDGTVHVLVQLTSYPTFRAALVALAQGGTVAWIRELSLVEGNYPVVTPSGDVLVVGQRIYLVGSDGVVRWQVLTDGDLPDFFAGATTTDLAVAAHGYHVTAFRLADGDTLWQSPLGPLSDWLVPPTIVGRSLVYAKKTEDTLFVFRQSDGAILRTFEDPDTGVDKRVFGTGTVPLRDRFYLPTVNRLAAFDTAGSLLWLTDQTGRGMTEPAVAPDGTLYVQHRRFGFEAMNPDGTTKWFRRTPNDNMGFREQPAAAWYGGPALAEGGIIYGAGQAVFFAYDAAGTLLWEFEADSAGSPQVFWGAPAIGPDGTVYTFTSTHVYAFWGSAPPEPNSPWPMWRHDAQRTGWAR